MKKRESKISVPTVSIIGPKRSGKTKLIEVLIRSLTAKGHRVAYIKHIPQEDFTIDTEGKDTWRGAEAGASVVLGVAPREIAKIERVKRMFSVEDIISRVEDEVDVVLLEGFKNLVKERVDIFKIITVKDRVEAESLMEKCRNVLAIYGPLKGKILGVPCLRESEIVERVEKILPEKKLPSLIIKVGKRVIPTNPFVRSIVRRTIFALIASLRGVKLEGDESLIVILRKRK